MELFSEYFIKDNIFSGIDSRIKLFIAAAVLIMILTYKGFVFFLFVLSLCLFFLKRMQISLKLFALRFSESLFIAFVIILLKIFFSGGDELFSISVMGIKVIGYEEGFIEGLMIGSRIMSAVAVVTVLVFAMPFTDFVAGLSWFRIPKDFIEILIFAYRYIFVLLEDAMVIYNAQKNRLGYSNIRRGLNSFGMLAGSLTIKAFENSQNTTEAMIQRGYNGNMPVLKNKPLELPQIFLTILFVFALGIVWIV